MTNDITFEDLENADELVELDNMLTKLMTSQKIQPHIKDEKLDKLIEAINNNIHNDNAESVIYAASMIGRLAAVARGREEHVLQKMPLLLEGNMHLLAEVQPSLDVLAKNEWRSTDKDDIGKRRYYAAMSLRQIDQDWVPEYCLREAVNIDTAENARRELLGIAFKSFNTVADWLLAISKHSNIVMSIENLESRIVRTRRLFTAILETLSESKMNIGDEAGDALNACFSQFIRGKLDDVDRDKLFDAIDSSLSVLERMIEMRFSYALHASLYTVIETGKRSLGPGLWARFLEYSTVMVGIRIALLEAALVLARQNTEDKQLMNVLLASYASYPQVAAAIKRHFENAKDLVPYIADWWCSAGKESSGRGKISRKLGNTEDHQIGALLIEVEDSREVVEKLRRAVIPSLEVYDTVLALAVEKAASGYAEMAQITRRLARMRKLTKTDLKGERLEYNILEHEMIGGHKAGVRTVKIVRDGIKKELGGHVNTLVKPLVESEE